MKTLDKFGLVVFGAIAINFILTMPQFIAFFTMDIDTGHYYGFAYPFWLIIVISLFSGFLSNYLVQKYIK